jgi:hypothetical protein
MHHFCNVVFDSWSSEIFHLQTEPKQKFRARILKVEGRGFNVRPSQPSSREGHEGEGKPSRHYHPSFNCTTTLIIFNDDGGLLHQSIIINYSVDVY